MSKTGLKKHLLSLTKEQIIELVLAMYDTCKPAKEYFEFYLNPDEDRQHEKYRAIIVNEFYSKSKRGTGKMRFSVAKKAIEDFRSLDPSPILVGDLMVTVPEMACELTSDYGDMSEQFYNSTVTNYEAALKFLKKHNLLEEFQQRCEDCVSKSKHCGYGFEDVMQQFYDDYYDQAE